MPPVTVRLVFLLTMAGSGGAPSPPAREGPLEALVPWHRRSSSLGREELILHPAAAPDDRLPLPTVCANRRNFEAWLPDRDRLYRDFDDWAKTHAGIGARRWTQGGLRFVELPPDNHPQILREVVVGVPDRERAGGELMRFVLLAPDAKAVYQKMLNSLRLKTDR